MQPTPPLHHTNIAKTWSTRTTTKYPFLCTHSRKMRLDALLTLTLWLRFSPILLRASDVCESESGDGTCASSLGDTASDRTDEPSNFVPGHAQQHNLEPGEDPLVDDSSSPRQQQESEASLHAPKSVSPEVLAKRYGIEQSLKGYDPSYLVEIDQYWKTVVLKDDRLRQVREHCQNKDRLCTYWATIGECDENPAYMHTNCGPACQSCHKLIFEERCPFDRDNTPDAWQPGDLNKFFERITTDPEYQQYNTTVICKPGMSNALKGDCPWIVTMDGFLSDHECDTLIEQGALLGYARSEDVGEEKPDGTFGSVQSSGRTSTNAWCSDDCMTNATVLGLLNRIERMTGISDDNAEYLQLLRYEVGQFYESHHDYIDHDVDREQGPRILTVFLYLNDVEAGGATHFTDLNLTVSPKRGRVLIWPSVMDSDPSRIERRTHHQAQHVEAGIKYGANTWVRPPIDLFATCCFCGRMFSHWHNNHGLLQIHLRNFKAPYEKGCT